MQFFFGGIARFQCATITMAAEKLGYLSYCDTVRKLHVDQYGWGSLQVIMVKDPDIIQFPVPSRRDEVDKF